MPTGPDAVDRGVTVDDGVTVEHAITGDPISGQRRITGERRITGDDGVSGDHGVTVRAFDAKDEPAVLDVLKAAFGQWPREIDSIAPSEFFRWKHTACPFGPTALLVAEADGRVIGLQGYMPWRLRSGGRTLKTIRRVDLAVHPDYRRMGVSMKIRAAASFPEDVAFTWTNATKEARPGTRKAGLRTVEGFLPRFVQPRQPLRTMVRWARAGRSRASESPPIEAETAAETLSASTQASLLLRCGSELGNRLATVKDLDYLRWRYGRLQEYRAAQIDGEGAGGIVIFRLRHHGPFLVAQVCELFAARNDLPTVRRLLAQVRAAAPADLISCSFSSPRRAAEFGFIQYPGETGLMAYPLQEDLVPDPTQSASWALSGGDLELL